jgi:hypothetical protein
MRLPGGAVARQYKSANGFGDVLFDVHGRFFFRRTPISPIIK